jgi:hypothetical protein
MKSKREGECVQALLEEFPERVLTPCDSRMLFTASSSPFHSPAALSTRTHGRWSRRQGGPFWSLEEGAHVRGRCPAGKNRCPCRRA